MPETKVFASLTSGLLARKGQARPAMRPQGFGFGTTKMDDLGWNDMGHDAGAPTPARTPMVDFARAGESPVKRQQDEIAEALAAPLAPPVDLTPPVLEVVPEEVALEIAAEVAAAKPKRVRAARAKAATAPSPAVASRKAAFTLRIEADRHLRLRLACAVQNRSAQQIVTAALDSFLADLPDVERLATSLSSTHDGQD